MLLDILRQAENKKVAVGHFNVSDLATVKAVAEAARELNVPVIIGLSEGERAYFGLRQAVAIVKSFRDEFGQEIFINADHTHSLDSAVAAAEAGFDSIVFDRSELPLEQNIAETKAAIERLKSINPNIIIEGEIGNIGSGSQIHDKAPENLEVSSVEDSVRFVKETGVDVLAPAVGTMHGLVKSMVAEGQKKRLRLELIQEIKQATGAFLTLHGASGTDDNDLAGGIAAGINVIHINTELRVAWKRGLDEFLKAHPDELTPAKIFPSVADSVKQVVKARLQLYNKLA